jgi:hypothetical protein
VVFRRERVQLPGVGKLDADLAGLAVGEGAVGHFGAVGDGVRPDPCIRTTPT